MLQLVSERFAIVPSCGLQAGAAAVLLFVEHELVMPDSAAFSEGHLMSPEAGIASRVLNGSWHTRFSYLHASKLDRVPDCANWPRCGRKGPTRSLPQWAQANYSARVLIADRRGL